MSANDYTTRAEALKNWQSAKTAAATAKTYQSHPKADE
jgi:hypothetical protein